MTRMQMIERPSKCDNGIEGRQASRWAFFYRMFCG
jgi:hypothetical protein